MNTFCIPIRVTDEEALYDPFYPSGLSFSGELMDYLEDCLEDRKVGDGLCLELQASEMPDMEHFKKTYQVFAEKLISRNKRKIHKQDLYAAISLAAGVIFIALGFALDGKASPVVCEVIASIGSFSLWGAIAAFIETIPTLRLKGILLQKFSKAEIRYRKLEEK